jgi:soluble lytic murein transglycosylase-like protein
MAIKISQTNNPPAAPSGPGSSKSSTDGATFEAQLQQLLQPQEETGDLARKASLQARLLALTLTRNLLDENGEDAAASLPDLRMATRPTAVTYPTSGHRFDAGQPSVSPKSSLDDIRGRAADAHGVDEKLVRAVIRTESGFDSAAVSPVGARGLMQLMPDTARELGVTNPFDPEQNVMAGTRYLRQLLDRYDGDLDRTLAAYNWGMGNVERQGMERMPRETRNYLARVKEAGNLV